MANTSAKKSNSSKGVAVFQTSADLKSALLVVSLVGNLVALCIWIVLNITSKYDKTLFDLFIHR